MVFFKSFNFFSGVQEVEPLPFAPILGTLHFAPSETESGQLVKGPASLKIDKLEGLTETIRIETTGRNDQMHKKWVSKQVHTAAKLMPDKLQTQTRHHWELRATDKVRGQTPGRGEILKRNS